MSSDVVLTSALRTNLQSLQNTQRLIDETQLKLATGLAVNSALDNPQNFFAAQNLDNRANDLGRLLDGIGQSIRTIEQADNGIASLTSLVEQAESIATSALEATSSAATSVTLTGNADVTSFTGSGTQSIRITATDSAGTQLDLDGAGGNDFATIDLSTATSGQDVATAINAIRDENNNQVFTASITDSGRLEISTTSNTNFTLDIRDVDANPTSSGSQTLAASLGFGQLTRVTDTDAANSGVSVSAKSASAVTSFALYDTTNNDAIAQRSSLLTNLSNQSSGGSAGDVVDITQDETTLPGNDEFSVAIGINGVAAQNINITATDSVQDLVDSINNDSILNTQIRASFDETTGQISLTSLTSDVESIEIGARVLDNDAAAGGTNEDGINLSLNFGFGNTGALTVGDTDAGDGADLEAVSARESIRLSGGAGELAQLEDDFNTVRSQIDTLVGDSDYRGVNLLNGDDLTTTFDEDRTNTLTTQGVDFTSTGLGIDGAAFTGTTAINDTLTQVRDALSTVRNFGQSIANDLAIIQTRRDFTESTINTLEAGADDLTVADQNEEGANLLSLQTRQQLGVTSLSLASQSQQAVLRLF